MVNETHIGATKMVMRGKELFNNGQFALAGVCYQHAKRIYDEAQDAPNSLQMDFNLKECLDMARQHGQDYEAVKELAAEVMLDNKMLQQALPSFSVEGLLDRARAQWKREDFRGMIETSRECQQFLPDMGKEPARVTRGYLDFYQGAAFVGFNRYNDAMPHLRAANYFMKELVHVYGEELWACCLLYLGQALTISEPENAERMMQDAYDTLLALAEHNRSAGKSDRDARYYAGLAMLELARFQGETLIGGETGALPELFRYQQDAVGYLVPLRDAESDDEMQALYGRKVNHALTVLEKCVERIQPSSTSLLTAIADGCEAVFTDGSVDHEIVDALVKTAVAACQRARLTERMAAVARVGRARISDLELATKLDEMIAEFEHRQGLETQFAAAQQAVADGKFNAAYPALTAAAEHAQFLKETRLSSQIERLLTDTRLRDPAMTEEYLEEIRVLLRAGNFEEAEKQFSKLRTAQSNNPVLSAFRNEVSAAKVTIIEQHVQRMLAALTSGDMDGVEEAQNQAIALARQLPTDPPVLAQARRTLAQTLMQQHLQQAAECIENGNFFGADDEMLQAHGATDEFPDLAEALATAEEKMQADRQAIITQDQQHICDLIAAGQFAEVNVTLSDAARLGIPLELTDEQQSVINRYQQARKRLLEGRTFAGEQRIVEADAAYREVLQEPVAASFHDEVQAEYDALKKEWGKQQTGEAEKLVGDLKIAVTSRVNFKTAHAALDSLEALLPGSYDEKLVKQYRHKYELLSAHARRHYCHSMLSGTPMLITAGLLVVDVVLCVILMRYWEFLPIAAIGVGLLLATYSTAQCAVAKTTLAFTDKLHPFSLTTAGLADVLIAVGLCLAKKGMIGAVAGLAVGIGVFFIVELLLQKAMPIRVPE